MQQSSVNVRNGNGALWKKCTSGIILCAIFLFCIIPYITSIIDPAPPSQGQVASAQQQTHDGNNTSTDGVWTPSPNRVDNNGGDIYFFFHLHKAGGTLVCEIAKGVKLSTDPNGHNCNIDPEQKFLYKDMSQLIDYSVSKGINFIANEMFLPTLGTFVKYMHSVNDDDDNDDDDDADQDTNDSTRMPRIHLATILRHPIDLLLSEYMHVQDWHIWHESNGKKHYSAADMFNETDFMHYIENKDYDNGKLLYRYSGWCRDEKHKIVDNEKRYDLCSSFANEWFDQFDIICFIDEMDVCIENLIKNYFCKYDQDGIIGECHVDDGREDKHIDNVVKYYRMQMFGTKQRIEWKNCLKNEMNIRLIHEKLKYEILFYNKTKARYGKGKFSQTTNVYDNHAQFY